MNISLDFVSNCLHAFQYLLFAIPIAFTSKNSSWRTLAVILAGFLTYANLVIASKGLRKMADKFDFCITILLMFFHSFSILIVACVELRDISQKRKLSRVPPALKRAIGAIEWFSSSCGIGTRWQVKTITAMPPHSSSNRSYLIRQAFILGWLFLLNDCVLFIAHSGLERWGDDVYSPMICQFHFSFRKWAPRIVFTGVVFSKIRLHIDIVHRVAALVSVSAGIYRPQDWPPLFGSMGDAYTLRDFWGKSWHQFLRWPLTSIATFITRDILRLSAHSRRHRYTHLTLVFILSGVMHFLPAVYSGVPGDLVGVYIK